MMALRSLLRLQWLELRRRLFRSLVLIPHQGLGKLRKKTKSPQWLEYVLMMWFPVSLMWMTKVRMRLL